MDVEEPPLRVLVVDDEPGINQLVQIRVNARGHEVTSASNGEEALAQVRQSPPDLIFLDVAMPHVDGLEVLRQIREMGLDIAIIMMTAFGSEQVAMEAMRRGADDYLRKPFDPVEFMAVLDRTVTRLRLGRQNATLRRQLDEKHRQLEAQMMQAAEVQAGLLPQETPPLPGFELAACCLPAQQVGGDFYDWYAQTATQTTLALADVMGKGMPAALLMATARAVIRALARSGDPQEAMGHIALALDADLLRSERFITLFLAQLDTERRDLHYVDAGHGLTLLRRASGAVETLHPGGLPLGILPDEVYEQRSCHFEPGDILLIYSDGLVDAIPELAKEPRALAQYLAPDASAQQIVESLVVLTSPIAPLPDDLTLIVLRCLP